MKKDFHNSRRSFVKKLAGGSLLAGAAPALVLGKSQNKVNILESRVLPYANKKIAANDKIRLAAIGTGIIGFYNIDAALQIPGVELVTACDLYDGRLKRIQEKYGTNVSTTRDYREVLNRKDIDAVLIAVPDHWHVPIAKDAMNAGKAVYCEKPMVHKIEQGQEVIDTEKKTKAIFQVGSNGVSSIVMAKAKELYEAGHIGPLVLVQAGFDRHSSLGAWQYSIPPDASPETVDFDRFLGTAPKVPFDPVRFFRWRNYQAYGTGIAGDLFVHLFSWLHFITSSNGPERIYASGGLKYWKDGRDVPDLLTAVVDYPETKNHANFQLQIRVNFEAGGDMDSGLKLVGTEGSIEIDGNTLKVRRTPFPNAPGYGGYDSLFTFPEAIQKEFVENYKAKYYDAKQQVDAPDVVYNAPDGYSDRVDHWIRFVEGIRGEKPILENATFGLRAAAPSLAANMSYFQKKIIHWNADDMKLV